jgi:hypothetical protein
MRIKPGAVLVCMLAASTAMAQDMVYLEVTGSWTPANYYVQSTGPTMGARRIPQENDDMVFGVAPSAGSTTFTLLVDTSTVQYFPMGYQGAAHPWYGYNGVQIVGTHRFGTAWWTTSSILTGLIGPGGARAALWTNKDLRTADPTLLSIRMFGHWSGYTADLFVGIRTNTTIYESFMLAEYYNGEHLFSESNAAVSILAVDVDVKPGSDDNTVGCGGGHGVIPVAIRTTPQFNALDIDVATVRFGPGQAVEVHRTGPAHRDSRRDDHRDDHGRHEQDIDGDGDLDLVLHFARDAAGIVCGDTEVTLVGATIGGRRIRGSCAIDTTQRGEPAVTPRDDIAVSPNPFNPTTSISFACEAPQRVKVGIYDLGGRLLATLADDDFDAGPHSVEWRGQDQAGRPLSSGVYLVRVELGDRVELRRAALMK